MQKTIIAGLLAIFSVLLIGGALAAPSGATVASTLNSSWSGQSAESMAAYGGNVSQMNVSTYQQTASWVGFWGNVTGGLTLRDAGGNSFYSWTVSSLTDSIVYACNETTITWSTIAKFNNSQAEDFYSDGGNDDWNDTFTLFENFTGISFNVTDANYTTTLGTGAYKTYSLFDTTNGVGIWAAKVTEDQGAFDGANTTDYQILAPASASGETYSFYLEIP